MSESVWLPLVAFPDESASFVHGFEAGQLWQLMEAGQISIARDVHTENEEVIRRMARYHGYAWTIAATEVEGWSELRAEKARPSGRLCLVDR